MQPEGFEIPIHSSLTEPMLLMGAPRELAIMNGSLAAGFLLFMYSVSGLALCLLVHLVSVYLAKKDPHFVITLKRYLSFKRYYQAW